MAISLNYSSGLIINEVEMNPEGEDRGNEWIEFHHEGNFNLSGYFIENNDGDIIYLNESFTNYYIFSLSSQWLDNTEEKVTVKDSNNQTIDETNLFDDSEDDDNTWQICDSGWGFFNSSKEEENDCDFDNGNNNNNEQNNSNGNEEEDEEEEDSEGDSESLDEETIEEEVVGEPLVQTSTEIKREKIVLNSVNEDSEEENYFSSRQDALRRGVIYAFLVFSAFLIILLAMRKL